MQVNALHLFPTVDESLLLGWDSLFLLHSLFYSLHLNRVDVLNECTSNQMVFIVNYE